MLESEVQVLSRLRHPNIVKLYDVIDAGSILCLVLELVEVSSVSLRHRCAIMCSRVTNTQTISYFFS